MSVPVVSVVISIYRRNRYLGRALDSVLRQTFRDLEVIVTEDGGSDCASEVLAAYHDPRIRLIRNQENRGAAANKLKAWKAASGRFLVNLDDDDLLHPEFVERLLEPLVANPELVVSFCDYFVIDAEGRVNAEMSEFASRSRGRDRLAPGLHRPLYELGPVNMTIPFAVGCMWAKERLDLDLFRIESGPAYDLFMVYVAAKSGLGAYYVKEKLSYYRRHGEMESVQGLLRIGHANVFCNDLFAADPDLAPWRDVFWKRASDFRRGLAAEYLRRGDALSARIWFKEALRRDARDVKAALGVAVSRLPAFVTTPAVKWITERRAGLRASGR
ncbi:MAG: hypothetical protein B6A08_03240 [Sorangiineae bacterium NIC37A_2]|mgnify:CR=1 FL=1|jgi:glycosyltransferase involved in cell wall biosynthesis|nr:MAG: hypothetical protein B6A08_03240 [Sorangiineae bacterium NIC37A_2]